MDADRVHDVRKVTQKRGALQIVGQRGAIDQKFAREGSLVVPTTRDAANAAALEEAIIEHGGEATIVELDLVSRESISRAFATIRAHVGDPDVLIYNAGYLEGRDLPPEKELLEHIPLDTFETAQHIAGRLPPRQGVLTRETGNSFRRPD